MLTKEECYIALNELILNWGYEGIEEDLEPIYRLIEEHFSNPPLKFEELKEGMWVWDNKYKYYFECNPRISTDMAKCVWYESFWYNTGEYYIGEGYDEFYEDYIEFEENRFYRKEVQE